MFHRSLGRLRGFQVFKFLSLQAFKVSSTATTPNDYRPISLLSILSKVLEQHVHHVISNHLCIIHPLSNSQWGFQPGKPTVTALLATVDKWLRMLDEGREIGAVFFDLQKALDSVPHKVLMEKLQQAGLTIKLPGSRWWWLMDQAHQTHMFYLGYPRDLFWAPFFFKFILTT